MIRLKVLKPGKEFIILRKARKRHTCHECHKHIEPRSHYIEDHINYARRKRGGEGFKWRVVNKICLNCWRGSLP